ncbi:MAG: hypothetical protein IJ538_02440 [Clostridia bacterium]|nr:hypothetical protein [Clostridia bacterium]
MNIQYRIDLLGNTYDPIKKEQKSMFSIPEEYNPRSPYGRLFMSRIFTAKAKETFLNGKIQPGDLVYFKTNGTYGYNKNHIKDESYGSLEDLAEVLAYHIVCDLNEKLKNEAMIYVSPCTFGLNYAFNGYGMNRCFDEDRTNLYGLISKNALMKNATIIRGVDLMHMVLDRKDAQLSSKHTIFNYNIAISEFLERNPNVKVSPALNRNLASTLFFDYFYADADRHCRNINFQLVKIENDALLIPMAMLDNGGGLGMSSLNCYKVYDEQINLMNRGNGKMYSSNTLEYNPNIVVFNGSYDFGVGGECIADPELSMGFDKLPYPNQIVRFIYSNRTLFNDFKNMYESLDFAGAIPKLHPHIQKESEFLPGMNKVIPAILEMKKREISKAIAEELNIEFSEEEFDKDNLFYLNILEPLVNENILTIPISKTDEIDAFNKKYGIFQENSNENAKKYE